MKDILNCAIIRKNNGGKEYLDFLRAWLKDKDHVALAYMTGILPIKKYGSHSALNMFTEYSMTDSGDLAEYFGFTENEVKALCAKYGMSFEETKALCGCIKGLQRHAGISYDRKTKTHSCVIEKVQKEEVTNDKYTKI